MREMSTGATADFENPGVVVNVVTQHVGERLAHLVGPDVGVVLGGVLPGAVSPVPADVLGVHTVLNAAVGESDGGRDQAVGRHHRRTSHRRGAGTGSMEFGVTVGDEIDRLEATAANFAFAEFGLGEAVDIPEAIDDARLDRVRNDRNLDLIVHLPFKQDVATPVPEINDAIVAYQERLLDWASERGAHKAVLHATVRDPYDTGLRSTVAKQLSRIVAAGDQRGVEVVVENVGHQRHGLQLAVLGDIVEEVGASVCFDVGHAYMEDGSDGIKRFCKRHGDAVSHLHVHDVRGRGDTHMPLGAGEVDGDLIGRYLDDFDGTVAVEVFTDDVALLRDTAARAASWFGESWP